MNRLPHSQSSQYSTVSELTLDEVISWLQSTQQEHFLFNVYNIVYVWGILICSSMGFFLLRFYGGAYLSWSYDEEFLFTSDKKGLIRYRPAAYKGRGYMNMAFTCLK